MRTGDRPEGVLIAGLAAIVLAAAMPAGLGGTPVPAFAWASWAGVFGLAIAAFGAAGVRPTHALLRLAWLVPVVLALAVPAGLLSGAAHAPRTIGALAARALASTAAAAAMATWLGPAGLVTAARRLHLPPRLVDVIAAALASLVLAGRQAGAMLRARAARGTDHAPWPALVRSPRASLRGFGRLVAALLLRSLERAEALEQARRARGAGE